MNDPKVEEVFYRFISEDPNVKFDDAEPFLFTQMGFDFRLEKGVLTVHPQIILLLSEGKMSLYPIY